MRLPYLLLLILIPALAQAKALPAGMTVSVKKERIVVTQGGHSALLQDASALPVESIGGASLSDDGQNLVITAAGTCIGTDDLTVPFTAVQARLENGAGMELQNKQKYADAIPHFAIAARTDPSSPVLATNLLSAQSMAGKLDDADKTLATHGPLNRAWFAWRLAVDSDLKNVRDRPAAKALLAPKPSKITLSKMGSGIAVSPLGLVATSEYIALGMGAGANDLAIYDLKTGHELLRLPHMAPEDGCAEDVPPEAQAMGIQQCTKAMRAHTEKHGKEIEAILSMLGFEPRATTWTEAHRVDEVTSADKKFTLSFGGEVPTLTHGKVVVKLDQLGQQWADLGVAGDVTVVQYRTSYECGGADSQQSRTMVFPTP